LSFAEARATIRWTLAFLAAASVLLCLRALRWRPSLAVTLTLLVLTLSSPPMVQALRLQQLAVLVAFFLVGCAALISRGRLFWAGCLLACATIKPQLALLLVLWLVILATGDWKRRQGLFWGFSGELAVLVVAGQAILPGWLGKFVQGLIAYRRYVVMSSWLDPLLTPGVAKPIAGVLLGVLLVYCVRWRKGEPDTPSFMGRLLLILAAAVITFPLLPGVLMIIRYWNALWNRGRGVRVLSCLGVVVVGASWAVAGFLAAAHATAPSQSLSWVWDWPFLLSFGLPPIVAGLLMVLLNDLASQARARGATGSAAS
jgi:glycosyl transferase family 87